jgi:hypothetical protein
MSRQRRSRICDLQIENWSRARSHCARDRHPIGRGPRRPLAEEAACRRHRARRPVLRTGAPKEAAQSSSPLPSRMRGVFFATRAVRVLDCLAWEKWSR